jgi:hypothetical protein
VCIYIYIYIYTRNERYYKYSHVIFTVFLLPYFRSLFLLRLCIIPKMSENVKGLACKICALPTFSCNLSPDQLSSFCYFIDTVGTRTKSALSVPVSDSHLTEQHRERSRN